MIGKKEPAATGRAGNRATVVQRLRGRNGLAEF